MVVLLTGGTGLLGNALGQELARRGYSLRVLARDPAKARLAYPAEVFPWNGMDQPPPEAALRDVDAVVHLAGENIAAKRWTSERKRLLRDSRVVAADHLAQAVRSRGTPLRAFVSVSGVGYYGDREAQPLSEEDSPGQDFLARLCQDWEHAADQVPAERTVKLRLGVVLSQTGGFLREVVPMFSRFGASRLGTGRQYVSWIHIRDVVRIVAEALARQEFAGVYNAVAPEPVTNACMTDALARVLGVPKAPPVPALALRLAFGELSEVLLFSQKATPMRLSEMGWKFEYADFASAIRSVFPGLHSGETRLVFEQWVPSELERVWEFFSNETNLEKSRRLFWVFMF
ncbi:MAG: TIGR01777 family protein [Calothrix sp. SM1_5_4]|nr:TIGR01777 family protein [Calothrix sp. SM1_5_4]